MFDIKNNQSSGLFLKGDLGLSRFDNPRYKWLKKLWGDQVAYFWKPEEINLTKDSTDFKNLFEHEKRIFLSNIKYQVLLDSVQSVSPGQALKPFVSDAMLGQWITAWEFFESIHSYSYSYIIQQVFGDPTPVFDSINLDEEIVARANPLISYYEKLVKCSFEIKYDKQNNLLLTQERKEEIMKILYLTLISVYCLEGIRFYLSFACSFIFAENKKMEGNAKIITLIAKDEALHFNVVKHIINLLQEGKEGEEWVKVTQACAQEVKDLFNAVEEQETRWAQYLFKDGPLLGFNLEVAKDYLKYLVHDRAREIGVSLSNSKPKNPLTWMRSYLDSSVRQVSPQETEITSYRVGEINVSVPIDDLDLDI
jgi:ribonucleoside-diphosphate reductase beta chain